MTHTLAAFCHNHSSQIATDTIFVPEYVEVELRLGIPAPPRVQSAATNWDRSNAATGTDYLCCTSATDFKWLSEAIPVVRLPGCGWFRPVTRTHVSFGQIIDDETTQDMMAVFAFRALLAEGVILDTALWRGARTIWGGSVVRVNSARAQGCVLIDDDARGLGILYRHPTPGRRFHLSIRPETAPQANMRGIAIAGEMSTIVR